MAITPIHQVWPKPSCKAQWKGEENKAIKGAVKQYQGMDRLGVWQLTPRGQWRTRKSGCKVICCALMIPMVQVLLMMMMIVYDDDRFPPSLSHSGWPDTGWVTSLTMAVREVTHCVPTSWLCFLHSSRRLRQRLLLCVRITIALH